METVNLACNSFVNALFNIEGMESRPIDRALTWARELGMNQSGFARALEVSPQDVTNWKRRGMPPEHHAKAAQVVKRSVDELLGLSQKTEGGTSRKGDLSFHENVEVVPPSKPVPLISWVRAGLWCEAHEPFVSGDAEEWYPCPVRHGPNTYCLLVVGDSMDAPGGYREGEIIFVDPDIEARPGDDVIARTGEGRVTFKRLKSDPDGMYLLALNPSFPDRVIRVPRGTTVCGVIIASLVRRRS